MNKPNAPPAGRSFYAIEDRSDGCVDVYLMPFEGVSLVVRGVVLPEGQGEDETARRLNAVGRLAEDIRARYYAWCASAVIASIEGKEDESW